jgi:hypothetical protein
MKQMYNFPIFRKNKDGSKNYYNRKCRVCVSEDLQIINKLKQEHPHPGPGTPCFCCQKIDKLFIDHCHVTGKFRGWICKHCNVGIGYLSDQEAGVQKALDYLKRCKLSKESTTTSAPPTPDNSDSQLCEKT